VPSSVAALDVDEGVAAVEVGEADRDVAGCPSPQDGAKRARRAKGARPD
jgi:hypothetical protein